MMVKHPLQFVGILIALYQLPQTTVSGCYASTWEHCQCTWVNWMAWSDCTSSCFGQRQRERPVNITLNPGCGDFSDCACSTLAFDFSVCNDVCNNGGTKTGSECNCVTGYNGTCCDNVITCGSPGHPSNGQMSSSGYTYGKTVTFTCNSGYTLVDGSQSRTCQLNGTWSGTQPRCAFSNTCASNPCANGGTCHNGIEMFTCTCLPGWSGVTCAEDIQPPVITGCDFHISVNATSHLKFVGWTPPEFTDPMGQPLEVSTNYPTPEYEFPWGNVVIQYTAVKPSNGLSADCNIEVHVRPTPCDAFPVPENGVLVCNDWMTDYGRYCQVACNPGLSLPPGVDAQQFYVCGASGTWSPVVPPLTCRSYSLTADGPSSGADCTNSLFVEDTKLTFITTLKSSGFAGFCDTYTSECTVDQVSLTC